MWALQKQIRATATQTTTTMMVTAAPPEPSPSGSPPSPSLPRALSGPTEVVRLAFPAAGCGPHRGPKHRRWVL